MIALLVATPQEAQPLCALLRAEMVLAQPFETYAFPAAGRRPGGLVVITGMGPERAAAATEYAIQARGARRVLNLGICGALNAVLAPGTICEIVSTLDGDAGNEDPSVAAAAGRGKATARICPDLPAARLATVREPVFGGERRERLAAQADVVDMEGNAVAQVCLRHRIFCCLIKGISDFADDGGQRELHRNLAAVAAALAEQVAQVLPGLGARIANFVKVEHTIFSLPLLFAGAWLGAGGRWPGSRPLLLVVLAGVGARALGMAMNRILDRQIDLLNPRTAGRELPSGKLSTRQAWLVAGAGLAVYLAACALLGPVCLLLSPIPAVVLISYSLLKRITPLCHYGIGVCLGLGPLGACVAVTGQAHVSATVQLLALFTFCWISGFDIIYALLDERADRELGVHSLPAALGGRGAQFAAALTHLVASAAMFELWRLNGQGVAAGVALIVMLGAFGLAYVPRIPVAVRFFPISAIAGIAAAAVALFG